MVKHACIKYNQIKNLPNDMWGDIGDNEIKHRSNFCFCDWKFLVKITFFI